MKKLSIKKFSEKEDYTMYEVDGFLKVEERNGVFRVMMMSADCKEPVYITHGSENIEKAVEDFIMNYAAKRAQMAHKFLHFWHRHMSDYILKALDSPGIFPLDQAVDMMQGMGEAFSQEDAHIHADEILTLVLKNKYKENDLVKAFNDLDKWYA